MSNGTNDREAIRQFLEEHINVVIEGPGPGTGPVLGVGLVHHAHAGEVALHFLSARQGGPVWGKADAMAEMFDSLATRHARGISGGGSQQFSLNICREGGKPVAVLPFVRVGAAQVVGGNGSLATEPPTATGLVQMAQRMAEITIQGAVQKDLAVTTVMGQLLDKLSTRLDTTERRSDERWLALQNILTQWMQQSASLQLRALGIEAGRRLLPLLPATLSTLTAGKLVPEHAAEDSLFDTLLENQTPTQLQELLATVSASSGGGPLAAILSDHLVRARKRKEARAQEHAEIMGALPECSLEEAERDAMGLAMRALGKPAAMTNGTNGHSKVEAPKAEAAVAGSMGADAMIDTMLESLSDGEIDQVAAMFAAKRPDVPDLSSLTSLPLSLSTMNTAV